jgi:hypothetical protein
MPNGTECNRKKIQPEDKGLGTCHLLGASEHMIEKFPNLFQVPPISLLLLLNNADRDFGASLGPIQTINFPTKKEKAEHKTQRSYSIQDLHNILHTKNTRRPLENGEVPTTCKCCCGKMEVWATQTGWLGEGSLQRGVYVCVT